ncbi:glycosyltransferase family 2 protein [Motilimonas pumila]|uniref:Glycosyltransferase family 2 protein n=1 Tax=Motilimonas pumila TaxID=2303987 RepID=A0A418YDT7_9GAMM|nr:glycosyltransferase family 2 protein [Motilimonas pumila]RJG42716.1 glycosyltransferase family 2 protein [Motilimonas pumila]
MHISIVILNWNDALATIRCAESVLKAIESCPCSKLTADIYLVDNDSEEVDILQLSEWHQRQANNNVSIVLNQSNLGFSGGMNRGIRAALKNGTVDYFWLLNNDAICMPSALYALVLAAQQQQQVAIWGATIIDSKTGEVSCHGGRSYNKWLGMDKPWTPKVSKQPVPDYIYGAAMLIKAEVLSRIDGLDEAYFLYFEELELVHRLASNETIAWCENSVVRHVGGGSCTSDLVKEITVKHAALSAFIFTQRYYPLCLPSVILARLLGLFLRSFQQQKWLHIRAGWQAFTDFLTRCSK